VYFSINGTELLSYLNRRGANGEEKYTLPSYNMISLASGLGGAKFNRVGTWNLDPARKAENKNRYYNEKLDALCDGMVYGVAPGDDETFCNIWLDYQKEYNANLPEVPLFNWTYVELHSSKLQNYEMSNIWPFYYAVIYASIG